MCKEKNVVINSNVVRQLTKSIKIYSESKSDQFFVAVELFLHLFCRTLERNEYFLAEKTKLNVVNKTEKYVNHFAFDFFFILIP